MAVHGAHPGILAMGHAHTRYRTKFAALGRPPAPARRWCRPSNSRCSREHLGSESIGWLHFQTLWNDLARREPGLFD